MSELDDLKAENARLREALELIAYRTDRLDVNRIARKALGYEDHSQTVRMLDDLAGERPRPWMWRVVRERGDAR